MLSNQLKRLAIVWGSTQHQTEHITERHLTPLHNTHNMALLTLGQASDECGKHKSTILDAIRKGRLSAKRDDKNQWQIDPAELFRVYPQHQTEQQTQHINEHQTQHQPEHPNTDLIDALRAQIEQLTSQVKREQENADNWKNQATMLLTHRPEPETRKEDNTKLLFKLFGRTHTTNG